MMRNSVALLGRGLLSQAKISINLYFNVKPFSYLTKSARPLFNTLSNEKFNSTTKYFAQKQIISLYRLSSILSQSQPTSANNAPNPNIITDPNPNNISNPNEPEKEKKGRFSNMISKENSWKITLAIFFGFAVIYGGYIIVIWGAPKIDESGQIVIRLFKILFQNIFIKINFKYFTKDQRRILRWHVYFIIFYIFIKKKYPNVLCQI